MNGALVGYFERESNLRQEILLLPFLFYETIFIMDDAIKGSILNFTQNASNQILLSVATSKSAEMFKSVVTEFADLSGLQPNLRVSYFFFFERKSELFFVVT